MAIVLVDPQWSYIGQPLSPTKVLRVNIITEEPDVSPLSDRRFSLNVPTSTPTQFLTLTIADQMSQAFCSEMLNTSKGSRRISTGTLPNCRRARLAATTNVDPQPDAVGIDATARHVFVTTLGTNCVTMLDAQSGAVLRVIPVGVRSMTVAVDTRTASRLHRQRRGRDRDDPR